MQTNELDVIFNGVFGSHLYGLSTPTSDRDYKGVYFPTTQDLIFNEYKDSIENQTKEVDTTLYALPKFVKILGKCDTVSMDMLHTPIEFTEKSSTLWEGLRALRGDIYCKSMRGTLGYIRTQASKYGHKVDRYEEMTELLGLIETLKDDVKIETTTLPEIVSRAGFKYIQYTPVHLDIKANIDVCGSRYQLSSDVGYLKKGLLTKIEKYGKRTIQGSLSGGDWKSISHSYRVLIQLNEIIQTRDLVFPLVRAPEIMAIKLGQLKQDAVICMISELYDSTVEALEGSDLPEYNNTSRMKDLIMNHLY